MIETTHVVQCQTVVVAHWRCEASNQENVQVPADGAVLFVPAGTYFAVKGQIKNVIPAVAKTTYYWWAHLPPEVKTTITLQLRIARWKLCLTHLLGRPALT